ncbi:MAG: putative sugar O-methyltransferase, partial [Gallionella sp.]|nr:putative sugar O-methyltransferase [Gallionella sp.]
SSPLYRASKLWESLFVRHIRWLRENGVSNFKRSVNLGYFQWKIGLKTDQLVSVLRSARLAAVLRNFLKIHISAPLTDDIGTARQNPFVYRLFIAGMIEKVKSADQSCLLADIDEPQLGNPWQIYYEGKLISQDLCNSLIEYLSISNEVTLPSQLVVGELGAGYGRLAYVFLKVRKGVKYVISDIPPAIFVSQWYLSRLFPDKKIFKVRPFKDFREIQEDYEQSEIAFFLPEQLELLPEKHFGLFINISSLGEMRFDQIGNYFSQIERLTHGYFYTKQWVTSVNLDDNIVIRQGDYPVAPQWEKVYERPALVQERFFEALYRIN